MALDLPGIILRYYDHWLKGLDNGVAEEKPVRIFVMGENVWRMEDDWPLERAVPTNFYLHSGGKANSLNGDGSLSVDAPGNESPDVYAYNRIGPGANAGREPVLRPCIHDVGGLRSASN